MAFTTDLIVSKLAQRYLNGNRLSGDATAFTVGIANWTNVQNATLAQDGTKGNNALGALKLTASAAATMEARHSVTGALGFIVVPNRLYTGSAWHLAGATNRNVFTRLTWFDSGGVQISVSDATQVFTSTATWKQTVISAAAPSNAKTVTVGVRINAPALSEVHFADDVVFGDSADTNLQKHRADLWNMYCVEYNGGAYWTNDSLFAHYGGPETTLADRANRFWTNWDPVAGG